MTFSGPSAAYKLDYSCYYFCHHLFFYTACINLAATPCINLAATPYINLATTPYINLVVTHYSPPYCWAAKL